MNVESKLSRRVIISRLDQVDNHVEIKQFKMATDKDKTQISLNNSSFKSYCKIKTSISPDMKRNSFKSHHNENIMT